MFNKLNVPPNLKFIIPLVLFITIFFNIPLIYMLGLSILSPEPTLGHYIKIFNSPIYLEVLVDTFRIGIMAAIISIVLGFPLAYWMTKISQTKQILAIALVLLPFWVSILVRTYAWIVMLGNNGVINSSLLKLGFIGSPIQFLYEEFGVIVGTINILLPFIVLPLYAAMLQFDKGLILAAYSLGAKPVTAFFRVYLPITLPAVLSGASLIFILTLGFYATPAILGGGKVPMIATMLDRLINQYPDWELAAGLSAILLFVTIVFYFLFQRGGNKTV